MIPWVEIVALGVGLVILAVLVALHRRIDYMEQVHQSMWSAINHIQHGGRVDQGPARRMGIAPALTDWPPMPPAPSPPVDESVPTSAKVPTLLPEDVGQWEDR